MAEKRRTVACLGIGLFMLGVLVGTLVAMSEQHLAQAVIAALFALFGGSLLTFLQRLTDDNQKRASIGVLAISLGALVGVYSGLYVNEYQLLTPPARRFMLGPIPNSTVEAKKDFEIKARKYLKENVLPPANAIDMKYRTHLLSAEAAYEQLRELLEKLPEKQ